MQKDMLHRTRTGIVFVLLGMHLVAGTALARSAAAASPSDAPVDQPVMLWVPSRYIEATSHNIASPFLQFNEK